MNKNTIKTDPIFPPLDINSLDNLFNKKCRLKIKNSPEGKDFDIQGLDKDTNESLQKQLSQLSVTAGREAASAQNLTVYNHARNSGKKQKTLETSHTP